MMKNSNKQGVLNRIDELSLTMFTEVQSKIINIRHQNVISDADIAELYGVETKRVNEAVKNNPEKFPDDHHGKNRENQSEQPLLAFEGREGGAGVLHIGQLQQTGNKRYIFVQGDVCHCQILGKLVRSHNAADEKCIIQ